MTDETIELATVLAGKIFEELQSNFKVQPTLTLQDAATELGVSHETVRKLCEDREIPHVRVGKFYRIKPADINAFLQRNYYPRREKHGQIITAAE